MMNNIASATSSLEGQCLQDMMKSAQEGFQQDHQTATALGGGLFQTPISDKAHSQLGESDVTDLNMILGHFSRDTGRRRLRGSLDAYVKTCQRWKLKSDKQMILLGYEPHDAVGRHVLSGDHIPPSQDFRDRIAYILRISLGLGSVFNEAVEAELSWLNKTRPELKDKSAFDYMLEGHMSNLFIIADLVEHERGL